MFSVKRGNETVFEISGSEGAYIREMIVLGLNYLLESEAWETVDLIGIIPGTPGIEEIPVSRTFTRNGLNEFVDLLEAK